MIRKAIGVIIEKNNEFLLVNKVKICCCKNSIEIDEWDFVKGGIKENENLENALFRELKEETGSMQYKVIRQFDEKITFDFPESLKSKTGFEGQETIMFYVKHTGDNSDLIPQDDEIKSIAFYPKNKVLSMLRYAETKEYFKKYFLK